MASCLEVPVAAAVPFNEDERLAALRRYALADRAPVPEFDGVVKLACRLLDMPFSAVSLIAEDQQWFLSSVGFSMSSTTREGAFCAHTILCDGPLVVEDASLDARFCDIELVTGDMGVRFYAGVPLRTPDGFSLGALCVLDRKPRQLDAGQLEALQLLASQVMAAMNLRRYALELAESRAGLSHASQLLSAIVVAQSALLTGDESFRSMCAVLDQTLALTQSAFGFMGEVQYEQGQPYLVTHAISDISWSEESRRLYEARREKGMIFRRLDTLFGQVLQTGELYISNSPSADPMRGGIPQGHPPLDAFMGVPLKHGGELVGMIGVANRPGGYAQEMFDELRPFLGMCANYIVARRSDLRRRAAEERLVEAHRGLRQSHEDVLSVLDQLAVGTMLLEADGRISYASRSFLALPIAWVDSTDIGLRWDELLPLDPQQQAALAELIAEPNPQRGRLRVRVAGVRSPLELDFDVHTDPRSPSRRVVCVNDVTAMVALERELRRRTAGEMIGESRSMHALYEIIGQVAAGSWTVLIEGETGAGKELVAKAIHAQSARRDGPFIAINCAGLSESLLASQLFGHVRGAFTGAVGDRVGLFEAATGGTLFLDEIGDVSPAVQVALLRALEQKEILRVGEVRPRKVDVRVIAATNRDLSLEVAAGRFRMDLLYRIRVGRISVPPLRERKEDLQLLVGYFLAQSRLSSGKAVTEVHPDAMAAIVAHSWPGNVRELKHAIDHAIICCRGGVVTVADLPPELLGGAEPVPPDEHNRLLEALRAAGGNRVVAARLMGISRATLYRRLERLGISDRSTSEGPALGRP